MENNYKEILEARLNNIDNYSLSMLSTKIHDKLTDMLYFEPDKYERADCCYGIVDGVTKHGKTLKDAIIESFSIVYDNYEAEVTEKMYETCRNLFLEDFSMLPYNMKLFVADVIDSATNEQVIFYVVDKTYYDAFKQFTEYTDDMFRTYEYYFYESDGDTMEEFIEYHEWKNIESGIYD